LRRRVIANEFHHPQSTFFAERHRHSAPDQPMAQDFKMKPQAVRFPAGTRTPPSRDTAVDSLRSAGPWRDALVDSDRYSRLYVSSCSHAKILFQSFFILTTTQSRCLACAIKVSEKGLITDSGP